MKTSNLRAMVLALLMAFAATTAGAEWISLDMRAEVGILLPVSGVVWYGQSDPDGGWSALDKQTFTLYEYNTRLAAATELFQFLHLDFDTRFLLLNDFQGNSAFNPILADFRARVSR